MSEVADHFRRTVHPKLRAELQDALRLAAGDGLARELRRSLHLSDRAVRQWATRAAEHGRADHKTAYARFGPLRVELGHALQKAAVEERKAAGSADLDLIAEMVWGIGERLAGIDPGAPPVRSQPALNRMAVEAGEILLAAGQVLGDPTWVLDEANEALRELVSPPGA
jgi:hypothetical protein